MVSCVLYSASAYGQPTKGTTEIALAASLNAQKPAGDKLLDGDAQVSGTFSLSVGEFLLSWLELGAAVDYADAEEVPPTWSGLLFSSAHFPSSSSPTILPFAGLEIGAYFDGDLEERLLTYGGFIGTKSFPSPQAAIFFQVYFRRVQRSVHRIPHGQGGFGSAELDASRHFYGIELGLAIYLP